MDHRTTSVRLLIQYARPLDLVAGALLYALGAGLTLYLGGQIKWNIYFLGQACVSMLQLSANFLKVAFDLPAPGNRRFRNILDEEIRLQAVIISRNTVLLAAATSLSVGAVLSVILFSHGAIAPAALIILGIGLILTLAYATPPLRLVYSGYGELIQALLIANIIPALAFMLQSGELHRLLAPLTFPLTALFISVQMATSLRSYIRNERFDYRNAMVRLGWSNGMILHNFLILFAYLVLTISALVDLPWSLFLPGLLTLPLGIFQIWQMVHIARGNKPNWILLDTTAIATFTLTAYFITFALWTI